MFIKLAFLNLWRRKSRTIIVVSMIALCLSGLMFMQGLYDGWLDEMIEHIIKSDGGEIVVQRKGYRLSRLLQDRLKGADALMDEIGQHPNIKKTNKRIVVDGMAATGRSSQGAMILGVERREFTKGYLNSYITEGRTFADSKVPEAVISAEFAEKLKTRLGKKLVLTAQGLDKDITSMAVRVVGVIRTYNMYLDKNAVLIDYGVADETFRMAGSASQVTVELKEPGIADSTAEALQRSLGEEREVFSWRQRYKTLDYSLEVMVYFNLIHYALIFVVVAIGITDIILISVLERVREFGIMLALGTKFRTVRGVIMLEAAILGGIGFVLGSVLGMAILYYYHTVGLDLSAFSKGLQFYSIPSVMHADIRFEYLLYALFSVAIASVTSALIPIWILKRKNPVQSITMA